MKLFRNKAHQGNLMVCYERSDIAAQTLRLAQDHAESWHVAIDVVSTFKREKPLTPVKVKEMKQAFHAEIERQFHQTKVPYEAHLLIDIYSSGEQLVKFAEGKNYQFIFIGISKRSKVGKSLFGSTAQYVILNAPYPVITVNGLDS
jgi:nucleotide-binding universal stress UspA family protein